MSEPAEGLLLENVRDMARNHWRVNRGDTNAYILGRVDADSTEWTEGPVGNVHVFGIPTLPNRDTSLGMSLSSDRHNAKINIDWDIIEPLRSVDIGKDRTCACLIFNDRAVHTVIDQPLW